MIDRKGFDISETLYAGENTRVVKAIKRDNGQSVIIKSPGDTIIGMQAGERYQREYDILKSLESCNHVVNCHGLIDPETKPHLLLEDFGGLDLKRLINGGGFPLEQPMVRTTLSINSAVV